MSTPFDCDADCEDVRLSAGRKKRPDAPWRLRSDRLPNPPTWLTLDAENVPKASIVLEVAVTEKWDDFMDDCQAYFRANTSIQLWVVVKVWVPVRKFWIGWAERAATGAGAVIHSQMVGTPNHTTYANPTNITYHIQVAIAFGAGVPIPAGLAVNIDIPVDDVRELLLECGL